MEKRFFIRRVNPKASGSIADVFSNWTQPERWLFVSPHDDDALLGAGLWILAAKAAGVQVDVAVVTDGQMGFSDAADTGSIVERRKAEAIKAYSKLGLGRENLHFLGFPDGGLIHQAGSKFENGQLAGLEPSLCKLFRHVRPTRVFTTDEADWHPDHRVTFESVRISLFHAIGDIWSELGAKLSNVPPLYSFPVYAPMRGFPDHYVEADAEAARVKESALRRFTSQKDVVDRLEDSANCQFLREISLNKFEPYRWMFD